jgi:SAM-dependent methyltransferase
MADASTHVDEPGDGLGVYDELADWFDLLAAPADSADQAAFFLELLVARVDPLETMLELGSGGGNTASHLRGRLRLTLTDIAPAMLDLSRSLNPDCEHLLADMRTVRMERTFDAVLIHDAIMYMTTSSDLRAAIATAFAHVRPGGVAVFAPDVVRETFQVRTGHGGRDGDDRALRFLQWTYDPDAGDTAFLTDFVLLLREGRDDVRVRYDRHVQGLFPREAWLAAIADAGFAASIVFDPAGRDVFLGTR